MLACCWLHIGTEKTGSTSIQTFFAQNRTALCVRGLLYPKTPGFRAHSALVAYSLDDACDDDTRRTAGVGGTIPLEAFRQRLTQSLEKEIAASSPSVLVLSNERLATRLRRPTEIAQLKILLDRFAQRTRIIVYLRNQVDFLASRYTNVIWEGGTGEFALPAGGAIADYKPLLDRWALVFGKENLVVRRFEPADFCNGDLIADFTQAIGLDMRGLAVPSRANPSLDAQSLAFLRGINRRLPHALSERAWPLRGAVVRVLQRRRRGLRFTIPRALAEQVEAGYRKSNEQVSTDYFGSRFRPLFSPPHLVCEGEGPPLDRIGPLTAMRIAGFLALGLLRDSLIWAARRLVRQA